MASRLGVALILAAGLLALSFAGCGQSRADKAAGTVKTYLGALEEHDYESACELLVAPEAGCSKPSRESRADVDSALPRLLRRDGERVALHGAQAVVTRPNGVWALRDDGGRWRITAPLVAPRGAPPPGEAEPTARGSGDPKRFAGEAAESFRQGQAQAKRLAKGRKADHQPDPAGNSAFLQAQAALPIRTPPLPVQQYIVQPATHSVTARPNLGDFMCRLKTPAARIAAVEAFYRQADALFRRFGIRRWRLVVAPYTDDAGRIIPLARATNGRVTLTALGKGQPSAC